MQRYYKNSERHNLFLLIFDTFLQKCFWPFLSSLEKQKKKQKFIRKYVTWLKLYHGFSKKCITFAAEFNNIVN